MKKTISMLLAIVMVLGLVMVPGMFSFGVSAEEPAGPVALKFHYSRDDGAYDDWDLYSWGTVTGAAPFVEKIHGDYYNVVGLPLCRLAKLLEQIAPMEESL